MQVTTQKVYNNLHGNRREDLSRSIRGKNRLHLIMLTSSAYTEEPRTNDNYFSYDRNNLLGGLGLGDYRSRGEHPFDQIHCYANFSGGFLPVGSKIT